MMLALVAGTFALFVLVAGLTVWWARAQVARGEPRGADGSQPPGGRTQMIQLAALAAGDESGRALLVLLKALDDPADDNPVTVDWIRRAPHNGQGPGMLVKITWDGNEWRRIMPLEPFAERLQQSLAGDPGLASDRARQLLADLAAPPTGTA